jgi:hypothetical protein
MAAVSPLADFSFDYQDLLQKSAEKPGERNETIAGAVLSAKIFGWTIYRVG